MLKRIGNTNATEVQINGCTVLFSYSTPVAYCDRDGDFFRTDKHWSVTTSKHINQWIGDVKWESITQDSLDRMFNL